MLFQFIFSVIFYCVKMQDNFTKIKVAKWYPTLTENVYFNADK